MNRRWLTLLSAVSLAGCTCHDTPVTRTAYAATASYASLLGACLINYACPPLCSAVFQLDSGTGIERCDVVAFDPVPGASPGATPPSPSSPPSSPGAPVDLSKLRGVTLRVTYFEHASCDDGADVFISGDDGTVDDSGGIDGGSNDGSDDGSNTGSDDGSMDGGSDDGSGSGSGSTDGGDDGGDGGDDGGDATGGGTSIRHVPGPMVHAPAAPHAPAAVVR